jgi:hypothetical protein
MIIQRPEIHTVRLEDASAPSPLAAKVMQGLRRLPEPYVATMREKGNVGRICLGDTHVTFSFAEPGKVVFCAVDNPAMATLERTATMLRVARERSTTNEVASDLPMGTVAGKPVFRDRMFGGAGLAGAMLQRKLHALWDEVGAGLQGLREAAAERYRTQGNASAEAAVAEAAVVGVSRLVELVGKHILMASAVAPKDPSELPKIN